MPCPARLRALACAAFWSCTTRQSPYGIYYVQLATHGGNQSFHTHKPFDPAAADLLYVLTDDRSRYLIPVSAIAARRSLSLGRKVARYRVC